MSKSVLKRLAIQKPDNVGASGIEGCKCDFRTYMLGDGCDKCNPTLALEYASENIVELEQQLAELMEASKALVARWETPLWKDVPPTAEAIYRLRDVINKIEGVK